MRWLGGSWLLVALSLMSATARAQSCSDEVRVLRELRQRMRDEVIAGRAPPAVELASKQKLEQPTGYDYDNNGSCRAWAYEVANAYRATCDFARARAQLERIEVKQPVSADGTTRAALEQLARTSRTPFTCEAKEELYLICQPVSDALPDAWCARRVAKDEQLEYPRDAWCKVVDAEGVEVTSVAEGTELTCPEDQKSYNSAQRASVRAERRGTVAAAGTSIAVLAAAAVPLSFVPEGVVALLRRLTVLDHDSGKRLRHRSFRARQRVLPLLGVNALSLSSLSSRFWWAGVLGASCGVSSDVMLAQYWRHGDTTRRNIGIAMASLGAASGLALDLETLAHTDSGMHYTFMPMLRFGVAEAELGLAGRF